MHWPKVRCKHAVNANTSVHSSTQDKALVKESSLSTTTTGESFVFRTLYTWPCLTSQLAFQLLSKHTGTQQHPNIVLVKEQSLNTTAIVSLLCFVLRVLGLVFCVSYFVCLALPDFSAILPTSEPSLSYLNLSKSQV